MDIKDIFNDYRHKRDQGNVFKVEDVTEEVLKEMLFISRGKSYVSDYGRSCLKRTHSDVSTHKNLSGRQIIRILVALIYCVITCSVNALCLTAAQRLKLSVVHRA